jgi:hypothetical protein
MKQQVAKTRIVVQAIQIWRYREKGYADRMPLPSHFQALKCFVSVT